MLSPKLATQVFFRMPFSLSTLRAVELKFGKDLKYFELIAVIYFITTNIECYQKNKCPQDLTFYYLCNMIIIYGILILIGVLACYLWWKLCMYAMNKTIAFINRKQIKENENPYILVQKRVDLNNKHYEEYLEWMQSQSSGVPIEKMMTKEEFIAEQKIKSAFNK